MLQVRTSTGSGPIGFLNSNYIDLAVSKAGNGGKGYSVTIENIGGMPAPVNVIVTYTDGTKETFHQTPAIWMNNPREAVIPLVLKKAPKSILLDGGIFEDADPSNNGWDKF